MKKETSFPRQRLRDIKWAIIFVSFVLIFLVLSSVLGIVKFNGTHEIARFSEFPDPPEIYGTTKVGVLVGKAVIHPHVSGSRGPLLTPDTIKGLLGMFYIHANIGSSNETWDLIGAPGGDTRIKPRILSLLNQWENSEHPYISPLKNFEFRIKFEYRKPPTVYLITIGDEKQPSTKTIFYGPSKQGRYVSKIIPMKGFKNISVHYEKNNKIVKEKYEEFNKKFAAWCNNCNSNL